MKKNILTNPLLGSDQADFSAMLAGLDLAKNLGAITLLAAMSPGQTKAIAHGCKGKPRMAVIQGIDSNLVTFYGEKWDANKIYVRNAGTTSDVNVQILVFPNRKKY